LVSSFLNDLNDIQTLLTFKRHNLKHGNDDLILNFFKCFYILYADDTVILAESAPDLQRSLESYKKYCDVWKLKENISKPNTCTVVFSKGRKRQFAFTFLW
jgi:hypothetical protein